MRWTFWIVWGWASIALAAEPLRIASFSVDVTPPLGSPLCDGLVIPAEKVDDPLFARGVVLLGAGPPIVLCAVDWVGIGNDGHDAWREALAKAAGTDAVRVAVHTLHQHDAPGCDFAAEELLASVGLAGKCFDVPFLREAIRRTAAAVEASLSRAQTVTHVGVGRAPVERIASNRRILGDDGKVKVVRFSSSRIPEAIAAPEGIIDPYCRCVSFWNGDRPLVSITYYATHPQSHYGKGAVSAEFVGLARAERQAALPEALHVHFNGAGGNVAAGKYNDGAPERRAELTARLAAGMKAAFENTRKAAITAADVEWRVVPVTLPLRDLHRDIAAREKMLRDETVAPRERGRAARDLSYARRVLAGRTIDLTCLKLGDAYVLHLPGELFIEYQLLAQQLRPEHFVAVAAYGDYGPGYIGTAVAYEQGGYETSVVSRTAPEVEDVLRRALEHLLH
uniref:Neutral/alkaline non-lysosomal ceramidase N-terminal domain-containing protein n=1 Tax=Schlesneria paludicola TaxID=360056 RepID=A0A7C4LKK1_9PLAN